MELGTLGVWATPRTTDDLPGLARAVESFGYGTFWLGGSPPERALRHLLDATETIICATGILNVWQHTPADVAREHAGLTAQWPGRVLLGVGIGHPEATSDYTRPLKTMRDFFAGLEDVPKDERVAAALGPKMLDLAAEQSLGTHPYFTSVEHTRFARERVGPGKLVAPEVACVVDPDPESARAKAREYASLYLGLKNYTNNLLRFEFTEADIVDGGSDRLIDAVVPHGHAEAVADAVRAHYDAGANHVAVQPLGGDAAVDLEAIAVALRM